MSEKLVVVCPHCDTLNRVPQEKLSAGGRCGECSQPLFAGRPIELTGARFARQLEKSDVPLLVDFWASWCGPCRAMAPEFERAALRLEPQFRLIKVNVDDEPEIARRFGINSIPTLALMLHGHELARTAGTMSAPQLEGWALDRLGH